MYFSGAALLITAGVTILFITVFVRHVIKAEAFLKKRRIISNAGRLLAFLLVGFGMLLLYWGNQKEEEARALEYAKMPPMEEIVRGAVHQAIPKSNLVKSGEALLAYQYDEKKRLLTLQVEANRNTTTAKVINDIKGYTLIIIKALYKDPRVDDVRITWCYPKANYIGEETNTVIIQSDFSRKRLSKIFDKTNLTLDQIEKPGSIEILADQFAENPAYAPNF